MKNLELTQMEFITGSEDCLDATISAGLGAMTSGALVGLVTPAPGGALLGAAVGWFSGSIGGFVSCAYNNA